ncbi:hypothetical protein C9439_05435 [archaeon SCG-AAA382B04]|nr:hypothetical protein C9439_05435 [archaeon SCG-AAA382B04]
MANVLCVDDEESFLDLAKTYLEKENEDLEVETTTSSRKALERIKENDFDCVVCDYQMPELDGLEVLKRVRKDFGSDVPFIVFTGKGREEVAIKALNLGADRYLQKGGAPKSQFGVLADAIVQEIEHYKAEKELEEKEERLELAMDAGEHSFWDWDLDTNETYFSPRYYTMLGYDPGELPMTFDTWKNLLHPEDQDEVFPKVKKYVSNAESYEIEYRMKTKSGNWKWIKEKGKSYETDENGTPHRAIGTHEDITERKKKEKHYKKLFDWGPEAIFLEDFSEVKKYINQLKKEGVKDLESYFKQNLDEAKKCAELVDIKDVNKATLELFDAKTKEYFRNNLNQIFTEESWELFIQQLTAIANGETYLEGESINKTFSGDKRAIRLTWSAVDEENYSEVFISIIDITERKEAEEELEEREESLRATLNSVGDAVISTDLDGEVVRMNPVAEELTGWRKEEALGEPINEVFKIVNSETRETVENPVDKVLEENKTVGLANDTVLISKDGEEYQIADSGSPIKDDDGNTTGVVLVFRDVTESYQMQQKLKESEERFRSLYESMNEGVCLHEVIYDENEKAVDYKIIDVNPRYEDILGMKRADAVDSLASEVYNSDEPPYLDKYSKVAETGNPIDFETYYPPIDKYFHISVFSPKKGQFATVFSDITERKGERGKVRELHETAYKLEGVGSEDKICQIAVDAAEKILDFSFCSIDLLNEKGKLVVKAVSTEVGPEDYRETTLEESGLAGKTLLNNQSHLVDDLHSNEYAKPVKGEYRSAISVPIKDKGVFQAISKEINYFDERDLEMAELLIDHVSEALERIRAEEKKDFLHSLLRHDIKNKSQIVKGYLELLKEETEENKEYVDKALEATKESEDIIEEIRTLREVEREEELEEIELKPVVREVLDENRGRAKENGFKLIENCPTGNFKVKAGELLKRLFSNLIGNAIKHSDGNKIRISDEEKDQEVICSVEDDGKGIPDEKKKKVFEKGYKDKKTGDSGLGLYLAKEITENYGGKIEAKDSELGGARFNVYLQKS